MTLEARAGTKVIQGIYRQDRAAAIRGVAQDFGVRVNELAKPGDPYTDLHGNSSILPAGLAIISFSIDPENLGPFWRKVDERDVPGTPPGYQRDTADIVKAVEKAGIEMGPGYMLDPKHDAPLAVEDDAARPLRELTTQSAPRAEFSADDFE